LKAGAELVIVIVESMAGSAFDIKLLASRGIALRKRRAWHKDGQRQADERNIKNVFCVSHFHTHAQTREPGLLM
jgi:hypothetical protein